MDLFFFSSRRRHTRSLCDWSSDVCSSDLAATTSYCISNAPAQYDVVAAQKMLASAGFHRQGGKLTDPHGHAISLDISVPRSEERRVGKERRSRRRESRCREGGQVVGAPHG